MRSPPEPVRDAAVALVAFLLTLAVLGGGGIGDEPTGTRPLDAWAVALAALSTFPLAVWRRAPLAVFAFTALASAALNGADYSSGPPFGPTAALFFVGLGRDRVRASTPTVFAVVAGSFALHITGVGIAREAVPVVEPLLGASLWGAAWFAGERTRLRRERIEELEERARRAEREAERERRLAAAEERTRIARDLHDSAGHAINVILVQAGAARVLRERDPDAAREALETIEEVARETLTEIDQLVRALREGPDGGEVEPPAGVASLEALVERHRTSGFDVLLTVAGDGTSLPPAVGRAAYRIVQEALTNAARHGSGGATVELAVGEDAVDVLVENPLSDAAPRPPGHGIVGMRERAALAGGTLAAGPDDGAYRVRARLPYARDEA